jgi:hypothetical protein
MNVPLQTRHFHTSFILLLAAVATAGVIAANGVRNLVSLSATTAQPASSVRALPLTQRVLPASALPGFVTGRHPSVVHSTLTWAAGVEQSTTPVSEAVRLRRLGFSGGVDEQLHGRFPLDAAAVSVVERYHSAAGAHAELAYQQRLARRTPGARVTRLRAIAIPGAFGWIVRSSDVTAVNVMFTSGAYYYLVGSGATPGTHGAPAPRQVIQAAQVLNLIATGCVAGAQPATASRPAQPMLLH